MGWDQSPTNVKDSMCDIDNIFKLDDGNKPVTRPISFVVVRFCDDYLHNFLISDCAKDPANEIIEVDNTSNLFFSSLTRAMVHGVLKAKHDLIVVVHEDVVLPPGWQPYFEESLRTLEEHDSDWYVLGSVGWNAANEIVGHWKDPTYFENTFSGQAHGFQAAIRLDEQILVFNKKTIPAFDLDLPGIHHIGRDLPMSAKASGRSAYIIDAPTIHKYADRYGNRIQSREGSDKIKDRDSRTYLADRACCNDYIMRKWSNLELADYSLSDFSIPFETREKLDQLDSPLILLGRGGGGTRLLGTLAYDLGIFMGSKLNPSMDCMDMVMPIYQGIVEKYACFTDWQKSQTVMRLRTKAAQMIKDIPHNMNWGFKLPESILLLPELNKAFPNARYVNYLRDPLTTCLRRTHMTARLDNHIGRIALPLAYDHFKIARSQILKDSPAYHMSYTTLHQLNLVSSHLEGIAAHRQLETSFEKISSRPTEEVAKVAEWLGVQRTHTSLEGIIRPERASNPTQTYPADVENRVRELLQDSRIKLGYARGGSNYRERLSRFLEILRGRR